MKTHTSENVQPIPDTDQLQAINTMHIFILIFQVSDFFSSETKYPRLQYHLTSLSKKKIQTFIHEMTTYSVYCTYNILCQNLLHIKLDNKSITCCHI